MADMAKRAGCPLGQLSPALSAARRSPTAATLRRATAQRFGSQAQSIGSAGHVRKHELTTLRQTVRKRRANSGRSAVGAAGTELHPTVLGTVLARTKLTAGSCAPHRNARPAREKTGQ